MTPTDNRDTNSTASTPVPSPTDRFHTTTPGVLASPTPSGAPAEVPEARWLAIRADLQSRVSLTAGDEPEVVLAESVTWSDGSLGCPQPGQSYTQALVDGMRVVVAWEGTEYDYRFGRGDRAHLCER